MTVMALLRGSPSSPIQPMIKEYEFFVSQGGLTQDWGKAWKKYVIPEELTSSIKDESEMIEVARKYVCERNNINYVDLR